MREYQVPLLNPYMTPLIFGKEPGRDTGISGELNPIKIQLYLSNQFPHSPVRINPLEFGMAKYKF